MAGAEVGPVFKDGGSGSWCFGDKSGVGGLQRIAEVKFEVISGASQGVPLPG
jgi:hypothetical protein